MMNETQTIEAPAAETVEPPPAFPDGEYAIVELMGHQTVVGRVSEVDRFGTKFLQMEPIYLGKLLTPILQGGSSIYRCTPCSAEVAFARAPTADYQLPQSVRATLPKHMLPAPAVGRDHSREVFEVDGDEDDGSDHHEDNYNSQHPDHPDYDGNPDDQPRLPLTPPAPATVEPPEFAA